MSVQAVTLLHIPSQVAFSDPGAAQTLPSSARFYACFAPPRCKGATLGRSARGQAHSGPGESFLGRFSLALRSKGHRSAPRGPTGVGSSLPVCRTPFPRQPKRGGLRSPTALGSFSTADGGEFYDSDRYSTGRGSGDGSGMEGETPGQSDSVGQAREEEGEKPAAAEDTSKRKVSRNLAQNPN